MASKEPKKETNQWYENPTSHSEKDKNAKQFITRNYARPGMVSKELPNRKLINVRNTQHLIQKRRTHCLFAPLLCTVDEF